MIAWGIPTDTFSQLVLMGFAFLMCVAFVAAVKAAFIGRRMNARRARLQVFAEANGLSFIADQEHFMSQRFNDCSCLEIGDNRYAFHVMEGDWNGWPIVAFDYCYQNVYRDDKGNASLSSPRYFSAVVAVTAVTLKSLSVRPKNLWDKFKAAAGEMDINFESGAFSRRFHVTSPDRQWAYAVLHPQAIDCLLRHGHFHIDMKYHTVIAYGHRLFTVKEFQDAAQAVTGLLEFLPKYLIREQYKRDDDPPNRDG